LADETVVDPDVELTARARGFADALASVPRVPFERQARIRHQLIGGEGGRLPARCDRRDDVGGQERQSKKARRIGRIDAFVVGDGVEGRRASPEHAPANLLGSHKKSHQTRVDRRFIRRAFDDELHFLSCSLERGRNGQSNDVLPIPIEDGMRRSDRLAIAVVREGSG
jgi:hypothetical protein